MIAIELIENGARILGCPGEGRRCHPQAKDSAGNARRDDAPPGDSRPPTALLIVDE